MRFSRRGQAAGQVSKPGVTALPIPDRADCCPARAVVTVLMPPTAGRPHVVDLHLCAHHYREARRALEAAGAIPLEEVPPATLAGTPADRV